MDKVGGPALFSKGALRKKKKKCPKVTKLQTNVASSKGSEEEGITFDELGLLEWVVEICKEFGMKRPTLVQQHCMPQILKGKDVMGLAQTGSGKTTAFTLPILHKLSENPYGIFTLVITPIRKLAFQLAEQFGALGSPLHLRCTVVIGGMDMVRQAQALM